MKRAMAFMILICTLLPAAAGLAEQPDDLRIFGDFSVTDLNGGEQTQAIFENAPLTLVNIWGTFCPPCIREMPALAELSDAYKDEVQFIGIVGDAYVYPDGVSQEIVDAAVDLAEQTGASRYTHLIPDEDMVTDVLSAVQVYPTTLFLDSQGQLVGRVVFGAQSKEEWTQIIDETLALLPADAASPSMEYSIAPAAA